jgi:tryptophan synthase alpha chain
LTGVTGARDELPSSLPGFVERVRKSSGLPIAVGFGISQRKHVEAVGRVADAAVIGSAIVDLMDRSDPSQIAAKVKEYAEVVTGRRGATA